MSQPRIVLYIATSLDGFIATTEGGLDWLHPFGDATAGFGAFMASTVASIMGRRTYEFVRGFAPPGGGDTPTYVLTTHPIADAPRGVHSYSGPVGPLADLARSQAEQGQRLGDIWLVGGGQAVAAFHAAGLIDLYRIFLLPVTLGQGVPLFASGSPLTRSLRLRRTHAFASGAIEIEYEPSGGPRPHTAPPPRGG